MQLRLLVDADEFWDSLARDIADARDHVYVQAMSVEGDRAGNRLAGALQRCGCADRRLLVDSFTRLVLSDRFVYAPRNLFRAAIREEARETQLMLETLEAAGVAVRFTNPTGPLLLRFPARNHKKLVVLDGRVAYVGGFNFSDHNFAWHDLMLRIEHDGAGAMLRDDFLATWQRRDEARAASFPGLDLHLLDGGTNQAALQPVFALIDAARESIFVHSPYLSFPFAERLREACRRGVAVTLLAPEANNRRTLRRYLPHEAARSGFELHLYQGRMSHLKAMLIDGERLILGSSNFDWPSYYLHQEIVAVVSHAALIADFEARVMEPDLADSRPFTGPPVAALGRWAELQLRTAAWLSRLTCRVPP